LVQASAGAAGGVFASFVLQPLEVAKTRIAVGQSKASSAASAIKNIYDDEGLPGVFRGVGAKCSETGTKNFIYFYIYDALNSLVKRQGMMTGRVKLLLGYVAGAGCAISTMPLEVLATRIQSETGSDVTVLMLLRRTMDEEGITGLFKGFWSNIALCVNPAIQNATFDYLKAMTMKAKLRAGQKPALTPFEAFVWGAVGKAVATVITFPLVRLKTILQVGRDETEKDEKSEGLLALIQKMDAAGLLKWARNFYTGLGSMLTKSVAQAAVLYMVKDQVERLVFRLFKRASLSMRRKTGAPKLGFSSGRPLAS